MRRDVDAERLGAFLKAVGAAARGETTVHLVGGATAVLLAGGPARSTST